METAPWWQSAIVRQSIVQILTPLIALAGIKLGVVEVDQLVAYIMGGIAMCVGVWTLITRIRKTAPNLSQAAVRNEIKLVVEGKIPPSATGPTEGVKQ